ncbi:MAG: large subunit ribosomal protein [Candidatus Sumerlaeota bacterium]|nr:large subunit ribosomal protein [Candidatus Sumerlaeota bacterium]
MNVDRKHRKDKWGRLQRRHMRIRKKVVGTEERPRLMVRKTLKHLYAVVVDDSAGQGGHTLVSLTTNKRDGVANKNFRNIESAKKLGKEVAEALKEKGIETVVFDRGGYRYHGVVKALCDAVREGGIKV